MSKILITLLRILFVGYMCFLAFNNYTKTEKTGAFFANRYSTFEFTLKNKFHIALPEFLSSKLLQEH